MFFFSPNLGRFLPKISRCKNFSPRWGEIFASSKLWRYLCFHLNWGDIFYLVKLGRYFCLPRLGRSFVSPDWLYIFVSPKFGEILLSPQIGEKFLTFWMWEETFISSKLGRYFCPLKIRQINFYLPKFWEKKRSS